MSDTRIKAIIIRPDVPAQPEPQRIQPGLDLYQKIVGGLVTAVDGRTESGKQVILYANDEGINEELPMNPVATRLWRELNPDAADEHLLGPVIVTGSRGPDDADVPHEAVTLYRRVAREVEIAGYVRQLREQSRDTGDDRDGEGG